MNKKMANRSAISFIMRTLYRIYSQNAITIFKNISTFVNYVEIFSVHETVNLHWVVLEKDCNYIGKNLLIIIYLKTSSFDYPLI